MSFTYIEVQRLSADQQVQEVWKFWFDTSLPALRLCGYMQSTRPSTRHKFQPVTGYTGTNTSGIKLMAREDMPLPTEVMAEAKRLLLDQLAATLTVRR